MFLFRVAHRAAPHYRPSHTVRNLPVGPPTMIALSFPISTQFPLSPVIITWTIPHVNCAFPLVRYRFLFSAKHNVLRYPTPVTSVPLHIAVLVHAVHSAAYRPLLLLFLFISLRNNKGDASLLKITAHLLLPRVSRPCQCTLFLSFLELRFTCNHLVEHLAKPRRRIWRQHPDTSE